jgi:hypothetical protein
MSEIHVKVTEYHIKHGLRQDCSKCMLALAIREEVPVGALETDSFKRVTVADASDIVINGTRYSVIGDRDIVNQKIWDFDSGNAVEPFEVVLEPYVKELTYDY